MNEWHREKQAARRQQLFGLIRERLRPLLTQDADSEYLIWWDQPRVEIWSSNTFFAGDEADVAFANQILRHVRDSLDTEPGPRPFEASGLAGVWFHHQDKLDADVREFVLTFLGSILPHGMTGDFQFHGYNDNMPAMWTWALAAGAEIFDNREYGRVAEANMLQLRELFKRRGTVSEYGMGYSTHRITGFANIAEMSGNGEWRELAGELESRIWAELAGHWSPKVQQFGGASMRGGHMYYMESPVLLYQALGNKVLPGFYQWDSYYTGEKEIVSELGQDPDKYLFAYAFGYPAEFAAGTYHIPDQVAPLFYEKANGFTFQCTAENNYTNEGIYCKQIPVYGNGGVLVTTKLTNEEVEIPHYPHHAAQAHGLTTYHGRNYTVGSSTTHQFRTSYAFRCHYLRQPEPTSFDDYGIVTVRYNINDKIPCGRTENDYYKTPDIVDRKENYCDLYLDQGRHHCVQHQNSVMCLQVPEPYEYWQVREMRTDVFLKGDFAQIRALHVGDETPRSLPATFAEDDIITIDEGGVYMAIIPLICRHRNREQAMRISQTEKFVMISLYNYKGDEVEMSGRDMKKLGNGFIFEVRDADEYDSFDEFRREMNQVRIFDKLYCNVRRTHYANPSKDLRISNHLCPYTNTIKYTTVNGWLHQVPKLSFSNEIESALPFMEPTQVNLEEDWAWLETQMTRKVEDYNPIE